MRLKCVKSNNDSYFTQELLYTVHENDEDDRYILSNLGVKFYEDEFELFPTRLTNNYVFEVKEVEE